MSEQVCNWLQGRTAATAVNTGASLYHFPIAHPPTATYYCTEAPNVPQSVLTRDAGAIMAQRSPAQHSAVLFDNL